MPIDGDDAVPRLNLFLYQVTPNAAWRNVDLPSRDANGRRVSNPPLALDLHYLLTAYGVADLQAEVLLGYGMQLLHENPVLSREAIRTALNPSPVSGALLPSVYQALRSADLAEQVELLKITPSAMNTGGDVASVVGAAGALPADRRVPGFGGADRAAGPCHLAAAGAHAWPLRSGAAARRGRDRHTRSGAALPDAGVRARRRARDAVDAATR